MLYPRLCLALEKIIAVATSKGSIGAALDSPNQRDWTQKIVTFAADQLSGYPPRLSSDSTADSTAHSSAIKSRAEALQRLAKKKLALLVVVDEAQDLDKLLAPTGEDGGARCALRLLRELQRRLFNATGGNVVALPLAIGIRPEVSFVQGTEGKLVAVGLKGDEALLRREDFYVFAHSIFDRIPSLARLSPNGKTFLASLHYPHVRSLVSGPETNPEVCEFQPADTETDQAPDINQLVVHAFIGEPMPMRGIPTWIPVLPSASSNNVAIPCPSFRSWGFIHFALCERSVGCQEPPLRSVDPKLWVEESVHWFNFESFCHRTVSYFLAVFGPIVGPLRDRFFMCLKPPLRDWFPRAAFALKKTVVLKHPKGRSNPTVVMEHDQMDGAALVDDFVEPLLCLSWTVPEAAWFWCGGGAPVDFVLVYTDPPASPNGIVTLRLRFADAKHSNTGQVRAVDALMEEMVGKAELVYNAIANAVDEINKALAPPEEQKQEAKNAYTRIVANLREGKMIPKETKVTLKVAPFDRLHLMLCHNCANEAMLSPATFTWEPWSQLLFCTDSQQWEGSPCVKETERGEPTKK